MKSKRSVSHPFLSLFLSPWRRFTVRVFSGVLSFTITLMIIGLNAMGIGDSKPLKKDKAYTFYLTGDRICKKCYWRRIGPDSVELTDRHGVSGTYPRREIIGVDQHPILRRIHRKSVHGVGLPGRVIVPTAFDDEKHIEHP